jgi:hypothetical protein
LSDDEEEKFFSLSLSQRVWGAIYFRNNWLKSPHAHPSHENEKSEKKREKQEKLEKEIHLQNIPKHII